MQCLRAAHALHPEQKLFTNREIAASLLKYIGHAMSAVEHFRYQTGTEETEHKNKLGAKPRSSEACCHIPSQPQLELGVTR